MLKLGNISRFVVWLCSFKVPARVPPFQAFRRLFLLPFPLVSPTFSPAMVSPAVQRAAVVATAEPILPQHQHLQCSYGIAPPVPLISAQDRKYAVENHYLGRQ